MHSALTPKTAKHLFNDRILDLETMKEKNNSIRQSDAPFSQPIQSSRFLEINDDWFFFTREKDLLGPYRSKPIVEHAVKVYINKMQPEDKETRNNKAALSGVSKDKGSGDGSAVSGKEIKNNVVFFKHPNWNL